MWSFSVVYWTSRTFFFICADGVNYCICLVNIPQCANLDFLLVSVCVSFQKHQPHTLVSFFSDFPSEPHTSHSLNFCRCVSSTHWEVAFCLLCLLLGFPTCVLTHHTDTRVINTAVFFIPFLHNSEAAHWFGITCSLKSRWAPSRFSKHFLKGQINFLCTAHRFLLQSPGSTACMQKLP